MDCRFYNVERFELPSTISSHLHLLRYIGTLMITLPAVLATMVLLQFLEPNLFWLMVSLITGTFGGVCFIIGMAFNSIFDRV